MKLPDPQHTTASAIISWYGKQPQTHRPHMGASLIGDSCSRKIWQTWRWVATPTFPGRILRLFEYGKRAEDRIFEEMRAAGITVWDIDPDTGTQWRVSACNGHFGGSLDAVAQGVPEAPKTPCVVEVKTHNDKSFKALTEAGVKAAKPQHMTQMQVYMSLMDIDRALYVAENKNTSELYTEWVHADADAAQTAIQKAQYLIDAPETPSRLSDDPAHWECKGCTFWGQCHGNKVAEINCRTCCHATPIEQGRWKCERGHAAIGTQAGCDQHLMLPSLVPFAQPVDGGDNYIEYVINGERFTNGPQGTNADGLPNFTSQELQHAPAVLMKDLAVLKTELAEFSPTVVNPFADLASDDLDAIPSKPATPAQKRARRQNAAVAAAMKGFRG